MKRFIEGPIYEHRRQPLLSREEYIRRLVNNGVIGLAVLAAAWLIGIIGYRVFEGLSWIDSTLNAAMILGGMGPVDPLHSTAAKLFASFYAIFSGVLFLAVIGLIGAPVFHRFLHRFHLESEGSQPASRGDQG
jgi:hypothetical protein